MSLLCQPNQFILFFKESTQFNGRVKIDGFILVSVEDDRSTFYFL
ncbi:MAG: hypothetical protein K0S31_2682 [Sphingobacterium multivorum]|jgi:hypothetical protein|nr:hypothetical protein [Sphingobacterium multivorum]